MPKLRQNKEDAVNAAIRATLSKYMILRGQRNKNKLMELLGCSLTAIYSRWHDPGQFRVAELRMVYDYLHVPEEERIGL